MILQGTTINQPWWQYSIGIWMDPLFLKNNWLVWLVIFLGIWVLIKDNQKNGDWFLQRPPTFWTTKPLIKFYLHGYCGNVPWNHSGSGASLLKSYLPFSTFTHTRSLTVHVIPLKPPVLGHAMVHYSSDWYLKAVICIVIYDTLVVSYLPQQMTTFQPHMIHPTQWECNVRLEGLYS